MRSRVLLLATLLVAGSFALPLAAHAGIPFLGPIIPEAYNRCPASWGMLIDVINNIISLLLTLAIIFVAPLMIAWAGFLLVVSQGDSGKRTQARKILTNTIVGIVVALAGYMIVAAIMVALYNPDTPHAGGKLGLWTDIIGSRGVHPCIDLSGSLRQTSSGIPITGIGATGTLKPPPADKSGAACNPALVQAAARIGGYEISNTQANILACIAEPESTCGAKNLNHSWNKLNADGKASTAAGAFQVLLASNSKCYENTACYAAAGLGLRGPLNCSSGFNGNGTVKTGSDGKLLPIVQTCVNAASDLSCSASAAACLLEKNRGSFSPWQADKKNSVQTACINNGGRTI
jgi:hypothetical protein